MENAKNFLLSIRTTYSSHQQPHPKSSEGSYASDHQTEEDLEAYFHSIVELFSCSGDYIGFVGCMAENAVWPVSSSTQPWAAADGMSTYLCSTDMYLYSA